MHLENNWISKIRDGDTQRTWDCYGVLSVIGNFIVPSNADL